MLNFICPPCAAGGDYQKRDKLPNSIYMHGQCKGGTWCDCQHKTNRKITSK